MSKAEKKVLENKSSAVNSIEELTRQIKQNGEWPCDSCKRDTYEPGYYVDRNPVCFMCSVFDSSNKHSQYWPKKEKEIQNEESNRSAR